MSEIKSLEGDFTQVDGRYALVVGRFNGFVVESLVEGAIDALVRHGVQKSNISVYRVPGAFEIPLLAKRIAATGGHDAIIGLGAVIRGGTPHFDYVAGECASGLSRVMMDANLPVIFGVLTVDSIEQAIERSGTKAGNKGADAAMSAMEMVSILRRMED